MSVIFGGRNKSDVASIFEMLQNGSDAICNESALSGAVLSGLTLDTMCESIQSNMMDHYSQYFSDSMEEMLREDAEQAAQMFKNNLRETRALTGLDESATPSLVTLTASIATTMRTPYEATLHRLFDTRTLDKQTVEIETVEPLIYAPGSDVAENMIDALSPYAKTRFLSKTEIYAETLTNGLEPGKCNKKFLLEGLNNLYRLNRDVRVAKIDVELEGEAVDQKNIHMKRGAVPYFDATSNTCAVAFEATAKSGKVYDLNVTAKLDFQNSTMEFLQADDGVKKVYFYATISHAEHTHPIRLSFTNNFEQFTVPTRPHWEVSLPQENRTDIQNSIQHFSGVDIVTAMTENITVASARVEDQRLKECLDGGHDFEAGFSYTVPTYFAHGNIEWFKREFIPFLDQIAVKMKNDWNCTDCHFRVAVSPYMLRILDSDYSMDKTMTEESRGAGVINYSIGVKTSTSTFYFISSQMMDDDQMKILLIPNNWKMSQVKTYNYFKYSSFLTDQLRRSDNSVQPAIVYSERNMPIVFNHVSTDMKITDMPITKDSGDRWVVRA